mmetsp:Transcript_17360/g.34860  ORF Transcript_17360/g.34860 Transcript_17360/m.34860 type:complete len:155 (+) Transcript_17360:52-516(+)|eukprot:CAMPEP_0182464204 /NCGR_PEP_ID=MMETSP1319-20130603/8391_1 /TAXON_ID=172717 /ORGANISM="Bolidomonas pacifica, Strain RCC208" /LENGTH=154 /DNA_ID=CAMNT_0024663831 /DNA_START=43 /DNA_END=507 /DNA_ORIENTATION=+
MSEATFAKPEPLAEVQTVTNVVAQAVPQAEEEGKKRKLVEDGGSEDQFSKTFTTSADRITADLNAKGNKKLSISNYRGKPMIHIREFYEKDGEILPGKKGIAMSLEQYRELEKLIKSGGVDWALEHVPDEKVAEPKKKKAKQKKKSTDDGDDDE